MRFGEEQRFLDSEPPHKAEPRTREPGPDSDIVAPHEEWGEPREQDSDANQFEKS